MAGRIFLDTEWTAPPWQSDAQLMWIGLADDAGRSWYGISSQAIIDPANNPFVAGAFRLIHPDEPRLSRAQLADAVREFCGEQIEAFYVWVPTPERFAEFFRIDAETGRALYAKHWNVDVQMLLDLVQPWPAAWPRQGRDLNALAREAGVDLPPRAPNHLHPQVHALWNRELCARIDLARAARPPAP